MEKIVNLLNEISMLAKTPRSGFIFLGSGNQSVAEHSYAVAMVGFSLAKLMEQPVDYFKLLMLCLVHDLPEARTGDLNYVNKRYVTVDEASVVEQIRKSSDLGAEFANYIDEYVKGESIESKIAHDADQLELLIILKKEYDTGNPRALDWFDIVVQRLVNKEAIQLAEEIRVTPSDEWWIADKRDPHWIKKGKK